tara:strand:+ start:1059 stop:2813 length:1755 start_codon:yes stop_codon:yes gene_type:complete
MEVAIPIVGLGAMYLISNQNKEDERDGFTGMQNTSRRLPNTRTPPRNYPVENKNTQKNNILSYSGANPDSDLKPYNPSGDIKTEISQKNFASLTGNNINPNELKHNNMVPFFGAKLTQSTKGYEGLLDSYTGAGSQRIEKQTQAPMFKPKKDMNWTHGMPSTTDFMQSRMRSNLTSKMNNVKPWEEIRVGPGLNKGYGTKGSGGFNAGMDAREKWGPKTVDQLRTANNPKNSYKGQMLGGHVGRRGPRGIMGKMEKNRPDTYYIQSADRWFTTTGIEKAPTARSENILRDVNRITQNKQIVGGGGGNNHGPRQREAVQPSEKPEFDGPDKYLGGATRPNGQNVTTNDYGKEGFTPTVNSRMLTQENNYLNGVARGVYAMVTPVLDILRPTKKQNVIGNMRPTGNANATGEQQVVWNPNDTAKTTIKEQTENTKHIKHGGKAYNLGHTTNEHQPTYGQRDTTTVCQFYGNPGGKEGYGAKGKIYNAAYNANLNPNKEIVSKVDRYNVGNHSLYNGNINVSLHNNRNVKPSRPMPNLPKSASNVNNIGNYQNRNTREVAQQCARNSGDLLKPFQNNPYTHPMGSVA